MTTPLVEHLTALFPSAKRMTLKRMVEAGRVRVNGRRAARWNQPVEADDEITVVDQAPEGRRDRGPSLAPLVKVYEDEDVLVVSKPAGLLTSTMPREKRPTALAVVKAYLAGDRQARVGLIHRLDLDASGLLVFSKNDAAYTSLKSQLYHHTVERMYLAAVHGMPKPRQGRIESRLVELPDGSVRTSRQPGKGVLAITDYEVIGQPEPRQALVRVTLQTGRKHQIRVHLSEKGWPIVGDPMYGRNRGKRGAPMRGAGRGLRLTAVRLAFDHPRTGRRLAFDLTPDWPITGIVNAGDT